MIEFDCETTGLQPYSGKNEAFLWIFYDGVHAEAIPFLPSEWARYTASHGAKASSLTQLDDGYNIYDAHQKIQEWFDRGADEGIRAWSAKFDRAFAEQAGCFDVPLDSCWYDGMLVAQAVDERRSVALKAVASQLFGEEAADPQKRLKDWLNAENSRRAKLLTDADKARVGTLRVKYVEAKCSACGDKWQARTSDLLGPICPHCNHEHEFESDPFSLKNRTRLATPEECEAAIAEAEVLTDDEGTYKRANYSHVPWDIMEPYALEDVILTRKISDVYDGVLANKPDLAALYEFERKSLDALYAVERRGIPARQSEYRKLEQEVIANLESLEARVHELAGEADPVAYAKELAGKNWGKGKHWVEQDETGKITSWQGGAAQLENFNPQSTAQIIAALKARGADLSYMSEKNGSVSADAENLRAVDDELAVAILEFRSEYKVLSTYVRPMIGRSYVSSMNVYKEPFIAPDSRIHATYRQVGARTGRMSCIAEGSFVDGPRDLLAHPRGIRIEDVNVGDYVYSFDALGVPRPKRVLRTMRQGRKPVMKLVWRAAGNKSYLGELKATPDHRVRLRDGSYRRMDALKPGDELAFLARQVTSDGYARIGWKHGSGDGVRSTVDEHKHLVSGEVVHHNDERKLNNSMSNLQSMTVQEHNRHHNPPGPRPHRQKPCPYTPDELSGILSQGMKIATLTSGHDHRTLKRWAEELHIAVIDLRCKRAMPTNHVVVAMIDEGESVETYDLTIEDTPNFVVNEIGVHNCADPNMQNQPRDDLRLRYNIVAEPGHVLVACDLSNIEMVLFAAYCGEGRLLDAVRNGDDLHVLTAKMLGFRDRKRAGGGYESARQQGKVYNFCVPLDTQILTRRGWLSHDQVQEGDETIGYDAVSRTSRWTRINEVHVFDESPLVRLSSGSWSATCTPQHRWITEKMRCPELQTLKGADQLNSEDRLILAAKLSDDTYTPLPDLTTMRRDGRWTARVLAMSSVQRRAWLSGFALGEGVLTGNTWSLFQNVGDLADAMELAVYLEGYRPSTGVQHFKGGTVPHMRVRACKSDITGQKLMREDAGSAPVWCVSTDLNTWTMKERGGSPMLTGNTTIYGGGLRSIKRYFRCSMEEARLYKQRYAKAYPEVGRLATRIEFRLQDDGYIQDKLISGRRFRVDPRDAYKATNYLVQGTAAALLKDAMIALHADGVPMVALVHDEILAHAREDEAPDVAALITKRMTQAAAPGGQLWVPEAVKQVADPENPGQTIEQVVPAHPVVPLRADAEIVERWSDAKRLKDDEGREYLFTPEWAGGEKRYLDAA